MQGKGNDITEESIHAQFHSLFLRGANLRNMLSYMCNSCTSDIHDPITHTICMFLSTPVRINITKTGLAPFQDCNTAIYPFFCMDQHQKSFLLDVLQYMQERSCASLSTQMGGGGMATLNGGGSKTYIDTSEVICQFFHATKDSEKIGMKQAVRDNICNVIIQRVCSSVHIPRRSLNEIMERVELESQVQS